MALLFAAPVFSVFSVLVSSLLEVQSVRPGGLLQPSERSSKT